VKKEISILHVEDSPEDVRFAEIQFKNIFGSKHTVEVSAYFSKALALVQKKSFDIIILDLSLPDSQGLTNFTKLLKSCNIPIIIYTGLDNELVKNEAMQIGAMDYLIKGKTTEERLKASILNSISHYVQGGNKK